MTREGPDIPLQPLDWSPQTERLARKIHETRGSPDPNVGKLGCQANDVTEVLRFLGFDAIRWRWNLRIPCHRS